jgi:hypothetical protein
MLSTPFSQQCTNIDMIYSPESQSQPQSYNLLLTCDYFHISKSQSALLRNQSGPIANQNGCYNVTTLSGSFVIMLGNY